MGIERAILFALVVCFLISCIAATSSAKTIVVDETWLQADFNDIQEAVDAAIEGDVIRVYDGEYAGNLNVTKSVSIIGNGTNTHIAQGTWDKHLVVSADSCRISNMAIAQDFRDTGMLVLSNDTVIDNMTVNAYYYGIIVRDSSNVGLFDNTGHVGSEPGILQENSTIASHVVGGPGILLKNSTDCTVRWNYVNEGSEFGIETIRSDGTVISNNSCSIRIEGSYDSVIEGNIGRVEVEDSEGVIIAGNIGRIDVDGSNGVVVRDNTATLARAGILFCLSENCTVTGNSVTLCQYGIGISGSNNLSLFNNDLRWNEYGISASGSTNSIIENNTVTGNEWGIYGGWRGSRRNHKNIIRNNLIEAQLVGIQGFCDDEIVNNTLINCGLYSCAGPYSVIEGNTINGLPIVYWYNRDSGTLTGEVGQAILMLCRNVTVEGVIANNGSTGIEVDECWNIVINGNSARGNSLFGIIVLNSYRCTITNNKLVDSGQSGLFLHILKLSSVKNNEISHSGEYGIYRGGCEGVEFSGNMFRNNGISDYNYWLSEDEEEPPYLIAVAIISLVVIFDILVAFRLYNKKNSKR